MSFLSCGQSVDHAASLLRSTNARQVLSKLQERFDVVLVDAPPMMDRAEGSALASVADGVVLVGAVGHAVERPDGPAPPPRRAPRPLLGVIYDRACWLLRPGAVPGRVQRRVR